MDMSDQLGIDPLHLKKSKLNEMHGQIASKLRLKKVLLSISGDM